MKVSYLGLMRHLAGIEEEEVDLPVGASVRDLLHLLAQRHGQDLNEALFEKDGRVGQYVRVLVAGVDVARLKGLDTPLDAVEEVAVAHVVPQFGGG